MFAREKDLIADTFIKLYHKNMCRTIEKDFKNKGNFLEEKWEIH
jgi:hypothetical protein